MFSKNKGTATATKFRKNNNSKTKPHVIVQEHTVRKRNHTYILLSLFVGSQQGFASDHTSYYVVLGGYQWIMDDTYNII